MEEDLFVAIKGQQKQDVIANQSVFGLINGLVSQVISI